MTAEVAVTDEPCTRRQPTSRADAPDDESNTTDTDIPDVAAGTPAAAAIDETEES